VKTLANKLVDHLSDWLQLNIRYFIKGGAWLLIPTLVSYPLGLLRSVAFARLTEQEFYGQYNFILSIIGLVSILSLPGINMALVETVARGNLGSLLDAAKVRARWGLLATLAITGVALYYLLVEGENELAVAFAIAGTFVPFTSALGTVQSYHSGRKRFDIVSRVSTGLLVLKATTLLLILWLQKGLVWLIIANSGAESLFYLVYYKAAVQHVQDAPSDPDMIAYGRSLTWANVISTMAIQLESVILVFSASFVDLAIYKIAAVLPESVKGLMRMMLTLTIPKIAERPDKKVYSKRTRRHLLYLLIFNLVVVLAAITAIPMVMSLLYSDRYAASVRFAQLLMLSLAFGWPNSFFGAALRARKQTQALYRTKVFYGLVKIGVLIVAVPLWGIGGIVLSRIAARWGMAFYQWRMVRKI